MEYHYGTLELAVLPHRYGCELRFWQGPGPRHRPGGPPRVSLLLSREGLKTLAAKIQDFELQQELFE